MIALVVGLGNPGPEYATTRHNAGFMVVDALAERYSASYWKSRAGALVAEVEVDGRRVVLAKPQSFMNVSGGPVKKLLELYELVVDDLLVVHDELDIPAGEVRAKVGGGHAGHNGLRSIHEKLGTDAYARIRIGIGRPPGRMPAADYVLQAPRGEDRYNFEAAVERGTELTKVAIEFGMGPVMLVR